MPSFPAFSLAVSLALRITFVAPLQRDTFLLPTSLSPSKLVWRPQRPSLRHPPPNPQPKDLDAYTALLSRVPGTHMEKYYGNKKPSKFFFSLKLATFEIVWGHHNGRTVGTVDLHDVQEIRRGDRALACKDFRSLERKIDSNLALVIMHGTEFKLKQLCLIAPTKDEAQAWAEGVWAYSRHVRPELYDTPFVLERWLNKNWVALGESRGSISMRDVKVWVSKINFKISTRELKEFFNEVCLCRS